MTYTEAGAMLQVLDRVKYYLNSTVEKTREPARKKEIVKAIHYAVKLQFMISHQAGEDEKAKVQK